MQVIWAKRASKRLDSATDYGTRKFGEITAARFYQRVRGYDSLLALNPQMGKMEPLLAGRRYEYRSIVVHEHYKLIYYISEKRDTIYIVDLWDTRQEPRQLAEETN